MRCARCLQKFRSLCTTALWISGRDTVTTLTFIRNLKAFLNRVAFFGRIGAGVELAKSVSRPRPRPRSDASLWPARRKLDNASFARTLRMPESFSREHTKTCSWRVTDSSLGSVVHSLLNFLHDRRSHHVG